jgi:hypothetical protein
LPRCHARDALSRHDTAVTRLSSEGSNIVRRVLLAVVTLVVIAAGLFLAWATRATPIVRDRAVAALNERFDSEVALDSLQVSVFPRPSLSGTGVSLRYDGRTDVPPLFTAGAFEASAGLWGLIGKPLHLRTVSVENIDIFIPPGGIHDDTAAAPGAVAAPADAPGAGATRRGTTAPPFVIDQIISRHATLDIASRKPGKLPRTFVIENLVVTGVGRAEAARYSATILNPVPQGRIEAKGKFGPLLVANPGRTPVAGDYLFSDADLGVIKGIGGILSSTGSFSGVLEHIDVQGETDTPDFMIDIAGQKVPLKTRFKAVVDGTNGDTYLTSVEASLAESTIVASGEVVRDQDVKGRRVALDVHVDHARIEDIMRLAVKAAKPPLTGRIDLTTTFLLPAGPSDVVDRLQLNGRFNLAQATFTDLNVQKKITLLSQKGRGDEDGDGGGESVVSNLKGSFILAGGKLSLADVSFSVPGALVRLAGTYNLHTEIVDFNGDLLLDASLADMTGGIKSVLARLAQPFFRRPGGGTRLPIRIQGPRSKPAFGLDVGRVFGRD